VTALVGMSRKARVIENLQLAEIPPIDREHFEKLNPEGAAQIPWLF
jgi:hypothetical protein